MGDGPIHHGLVAGVLLRLMPVAAGLLLGAFVLRAFFGSAAQIDEAVTGVGGYSDSPAQVRSAAILGGCLILGAIVIAVGRVI